MIYTRENIEEEKDYRRLQSMGKALEEEAGDDIALNLRKEELRTRCLEVYDEFFCLDEKEEEEDGPIELSEPEPEIESEPEEEKVPDEELYYAENSYADWESGWAFEPGQDPKPLPATLSQGLKNAIQMKRIRKVE